MEFIKNKKFLNFSFFLCVLFSLISFLWSFFINSEKIKIPFLGKINAPVVVNVEIDESEASNFHFYMNKNEIRPYSLFKGNSYLIYEAQYPVYYLYFRANDNVINKINSITLNLGKNFYYYNREDILNFDKGRKDEYILPFDIKYLKNSKYTNDKGQINRFSANFLSVFYNSNFYIIPLFWLFLAILIYQYNKEKFSFNFNLFKNSAILWILILALILRLADLNIPFWWDELYTASVASGKFEPFIRVFQDAWNPPLFYFLSKIWILLFGDTEVICRFLTVLISISSTIVLYLFVKRNFNRNAALLSAFLFSINVYAIHSAQEFRSYALSILLSLLSAYYLFEIIKNKKNKDFIIYGIIAALMANNHYFQILFLINNFIFGLVLLDKNSKLKFLYSNLFAAFCFLPFFIGVGLKQGLLAGGAEQLPLYDIKSTLLILITYFSNRIVPFLLFLMSVLLLFNKTRNFIFNEDKSLFLLFVYSFYSTIMLFVSSYIFSHLIKPVIKIYYFVGVVPFVAISIALVFYLSFKNKILKFIICAFVFANGIFCFSGRGIYVDKDDMLVIRLEETFKYAYFDSNQFKNKKIAILTLDHDKEYLDYYKNFKKDFLPVTYKFGTQTPKILEDKISETNADVIYLMLHKAWALDYAEYFKSKYNVSLILTDKNVFIGRLIKK